MIQGYKEKITHNEEEFTLQLITKDFLYYCNVLESDDNGNTIIMNKEGNVIGDNIFATNSFIEDLQGGEWEYIGKDTLYAIENGFLEE